MTETADDSETFRDLTEGDEITYAQIREAMKGKSFEMELVGEEATIALTAINQGIDARLQACFIPSLGDRYEWRNHDIRIDDGNGGAKECRLSTKLFLSLSPESLPVFLRRLAEDFYAEETDGEDGCEDDIATSLCGSIINIVLHPEDTD